VKQSTILTLTGALLLSLVTPARSQAPPPTGNASTKLPAYELAAIKPSKPGIGSRILFTADGVTATRFTLKAMIKMAYRINDDQITGGPKWIDSDTYDLEAKVDSSEVAEFSKLDENQRSQMFQNLLTERFRLGIHRETRDLPVYVLTIAKNGPKVQEAKPGDTYPDGFKGPDGKPFGHAGPMSWGNGRLTGQGIPLAQMAAALSQQLGRTVQDRTELKGNYDIKLEWTPDEPQRPQPGPENALATDSPSPSLFTAIQEQLGLKLESRKAPVEILVIDHAEPPPEN
jgi:uncharacterized protein (TIGR03435 family)